MRSVIKILDKATAELSVCLENHLTSLSPEAKKHIDYAQELLLDLMYSMEDFERNIE